jgi:hypothetical protein
MDDEIIDLRGNPAEVLRAILRRWNAGPLDAGDEAALDEMARFCAEPVGPREAGPPGPPSVATDRRGGP